MTESESPPVLYSFRRCPYAIRARMALTCACTRVELREVVLSRKPRELVAASAKATVPVLVLPDGSVIDESFDIMKWALARRDPHGWLDIDITAANSLVDRNDGEFKQNLDCYKYPERFPGDSPAASREKGLRFLQMLNDYLERQEYLLGERISIADVAVAPFVRQFAHVDSAWFESAVGRSLNDWLMRFETSSLFLSVMQKYLPWSPGERVVVFGPGSSL